MASLPVRPALRRSDRSSIQLQSFRKFSFEMFHLRAADGKNAHLLLAAKFEAPS